MLFRKLAIRILSVCILAFVAWRLLNFSTVIGVDPGQGLGVQMYDTLYQNRHLFEERHIDQLGLVISQRDAALFSYVKHSLIPIEVWTHRTDIDYVLVVGFGSALPSVMKTNGQWQMDMTIADDLVVYRRNRQP